MPIVFEAFLKFIPFSYHDCLKHVVKLITNVVFPLNSYFNFSFQFGLFLILKFLSNSGFTSPNPLRKKVGVAFALLLVLAEFPISTKFPFHRRGNSFSYPILGAFKSAVFFR